jgi:hypothetical protein
MSEIPLNLNREFTFLLNGSQKKGWLRLRKLYFDETKAQWRCDWSLDYLYPNTVHFSGDDPLQALTRTLDFASSLIRGSIIGGDRLYWQYDGDLGGLDFPQSESGDWKLRPEDLETNNKPETNESS